MKLCSYNSAGVSMFTLALVFSLGACTPTDPRPTTEHGVAPESATAQTDAQTPESAMTQTDALIVELRLLMDRGEFEEGLRLLDRAIPRTSDALSLARITAARAVLLGRLGTYDEALALSSRALRELESLDAPARVITEALSGLGAVHWVRGESEEALQSWTRALELREGEDVESRRFRARMAYNRGLVLPSVGRWEEAVESVVLALEQEALSGAPECPDLAVTRAQLGFLLNAVGRAEEAKAHYTAALDTCGEQAEVELVRADLQAGLASVLIGLGELERAQELARQARALYEGSSDPQGKQLHVAIIESRALRAAGRFADADALIVEVLAIAESRMSDQLGARHALCVERLHTLEGLADAELGAQVRTKCEGRAAALGWMEGSPDRAVVDNAARWLEPDGGAAR